MRKSTWRVITVLVGALFTVTAFAAAGVTPAQAASFPSTTLGVWDGTPAGIPNGAHPDVLNSYFYTTNPVSEVSSFVNSMPANVTPFVEIEPWNGPGSDCSEWSNFTSNNGAARSYESGLGSVIASYGKPVIVTFAHEFNIGGGQYPWAAGDECGTSGGTWAAAWKNFVTNVRAKANGHAYFMWAANVDHGSDFTLAAQYWPGPATVDMTGVDGYSGFCQCGMTFADLFGGTFNEIRHLSGFSSVPQQRIFIAETDMNEYDASGISSFVGDLCGAGGGDGLLQFQDGTPALSPGQWSALDSALSAHCSSGSPRPPVLPPPPHPACAVTLSQGHASAVSPVREDVFWHQSAPSWDKLTIHGPGAINGHTGYVHVTGHLGEGVYGGLVPGQPYTVTIQPEASPHGAAESCPGHVFFVS